ncbi:MAG: ParB/RepB/Spo0J family partition protein [Candidatus Sumerlaeota bacterium]
MQIHTWPLETIAIERIALEDRAFFLRSSLEECPADLCASIERIGLVTPPILRKVGDEQYRIVNGFARIGVFKKLGAAGLLCRVAPVSVADSELLLAAIETNMHERSLNRVEQALAAEKALEQWPESEVIETVLPLLGRKRARPVLARLLQIAALPPFLSEALARGDIPEKAVMELDTLSTAEQELAGRCMMEMRLSSGACRDFAKLVSEICGRDKISLGQLLENVACDPQAMNGSEIIESLRALRNPILTDIRRDYEGALDTIDLPHGARFTPPPDFEGERCRLTIDADDAETFRETVRVLHERLKQHPDALERLFSPRVQP